MVTNCCGERSFSKLKYLKNTLRSRLNQNHLNMLSILYIENEVLHSIDMSEVISKFATVKSSKSDRFSSHNIDI